MMNFFSTFFYNLKKYSFFYIYTRLFGSYFVNNEVSHTSRDIIKYKRIIIYGFGPYGEEYFIKHFFYNRIIGIYDRNFELMDSHVESPDCINHDSFDYVLITVMDESARLSVESFLLKKNISKDKIVSVNYEN